MLEREGLQGKQPGSLKTDGNHYPWPLGPAWEAVSVKSSRSREWKQSLPAKWPQRVTSPRGDRVATTAWTGPPAGGQACSQPQDPLQGRREAGWGGRSSGLRRGVGGSGRQVPRACGSSSSLPRALDLGSALVKSLSWQLRGSQTEQGLTNRNAQRNPNEALGQWHHPSVCSIQEQP